MDLPDIEKGFSIRRGSRSIKIGSRVIAAPMAGVLEPPYRMLLHELGLELSFTEMVSARGTFEASKRTMELAGWVPETGYSAAQIFGADPKYLSHAAMRMEELGHHIIDLNTGCPKRKVMAQGSGGAMLKDPENLLLCLSSILDSVKVPVGIKMRSGYHHFEKDLYGGLLKDIEGLGISYVAIHPRSVVQGFRGDADREVISFASSIVDVPIIASGDARTVSDIEDYLSRGASAVMIGRGMMGDPRLIERLNDGKDLDREKDPKGHIKDIFSLARKHLDLNIDYFGEKRGCIKFRPHLGWYVKGFRGISPMRDRIYHVENRDETLALMIDIETGWLDSI